MRCVRDDYLVAVVNPGADGAPRGHRRDARNIVTEFHFRILVLVNARARLNTGSINRGHCRARRI
jgi:hypothetical protein